MTSCHFPISMLNVHLKSRHHHHHHQYYLLLTLNFVFSLKIPNAPPALETSVYRVVETKVAHLNGEIMQLREGLTNELQDGTGKLRSLLTRKMFAHNLQVVRTPKCWFQLLFVIGFWRRSILILSVLAQKLWLIS